MSALPPEADMCSATWHVRFVPKRTHAVQQLGSLLDHLVGKTEQSGRHFNAERLRGFGIDGHGQERIYRVRDGRGTARLLKCVFDMTKFLLGGQIDCTLGRFVQCLCQAALRRPWL
jgi:hypothetical protein